MKKLLLVLLAALSYSVVLSETIKTKQVNEGGTGMFRVIAVKDSKMPDFVIYRPQDLIQGNVRN